MGGKTYWVRKNLKYENKLFLKDELVIDLLEDHDDWACLQFDKIFCFSRNKEGVDPESKMKQVGQELTRQESEMRKRKVETREVKKP